MASPPRPSDRDATTIAERLFTLEEEKAGPEERASGEAKAKPSREIEEKVPEGSERWKLGACIGSGGMARVYKAVDRRLRRTVALKILVHDDPAMLRRFQREARAQARVHHEHILEVYDVGEIDSQPYIAMHYVEGATLRELFDDLSVEQKVHVFVQVAEALHAAHLAGLLHRDVKPSNILVERRDGGELKAWVADFGIVTEIEDPSISSSLTGTGGFIGTPVYIPPERLMTPKERQSKEAPADPRGDVYSLGITMYQTLTGEVPFVDEDFLDLLEKIVKEDPRPPSDVKPEIPAPLERIVLKCLAKYPEQRYSSAREVATKLRGCLPGREARRPSAVGRWKAFAAAAVLLLAGLAVGLGWRVLVPDGSASQRLRQAENQAWEKDPGAAEQELRALARVHFWSATLLRQQGDLGAAEKELRASLAASRRLASENENGVGWRQLASSLCLLGTVLREKGELEAAREEYRRVLEVLTSVAEDEDVELGVLGIEKALAGLADGTGEADPCLPLADF